MYRNFYSMAKDPFAIHPSPDNYFGSRSHDQALHLLLESVKEEEPYILITGEYGIGKTLLCLKLWQFLETRPDIAAVTLSSPTAPYHLLLRSIALKFKMANITDSSKTLAQLEAALLNLFISGNLRKSVYIVIDDLQDYTEQMLLHFRYLSNFHVKDFYPFRLICFSYSGFIQELGNHPKFIPFIQRFRRRITIQPLLNDELKEYIYFRLLQAGAKGRPIFDDNSLQHIADISGKIPRLVNNLCDRILLRAVDLKADRINVELVREVCRRDEVEKMPMKSANIQNTGKDRNDGNTAKKTGISINLDAIAIDYGHKQEMDEVVFLPDDAHNRNQLKMTAIVLGAVILLVSLFFLWNRSTEHDTPVLPKNRNISLQPQSNINQKNKNALSSAAAITTRNEEVRQQENRMNSHEGSATGETPVNSRIKIHGMTTVDPSGTATESTLTPYEKHYTGEKMKRQTPAGNDSKQS